MRDGRKTATQRGTRAKRTCESLARGTRSILPILLTLACSRTAPEVSSAPPAPLPPGAAQAGTPAAPEPAAKGMVPMKKVEIRVGGCLHDCGDPVQSVTRFLEALADPAAAEAASRFLDSTRLIVDGRALGAEWVVMWKELRAASRSDGILETVRDLSAWTRGRTPDQVRAAIAVGPRPIKVWSTEAEFEFIPGGSAEPWTFVLRPRGLEWLVVEVRTRAAAPAGRQAP